jgi:hypothetical protein
MVEIILDFFSNLKEHKFIDYSYVQQVLYSRSVFKCNFVGLLQFAVIWSYALWFAALASEIVTIFLICIDQNCILESCVHRSKSQH